MLKHFQLNVHPTNSNTRKASQLECPGKRISTDPDSPLPRSVIFENSERYESVEKIEIRGKIVPFATEKTQSRVFAEFTFNLRCPTRAATPCPAVSRGIPRVSGETEPGDNTFGKNTGNRIFRRWPAALIKILARPRSETVRTAFRSSYTPASRVRGFVFIASPAVSPF